MADYTKITPIAPMVEKLQEDENDQNKHDNLNWERYGCCSWYPSTLKRLSSGRFFLLFMCMLIFSDAFNIGSIGGAMTSLETRYNLEASELGLIQSLYEASNLIFVIFVVHFVGRKENRRPMWIGLGALTMAVGTAIAVAPQFIFSAYEPDWRSSSDATSTNQTATHSIVCLGPANESATLELMDQSCQQDTIHRDDPMMENRMAYVMIMCGEILVGVGWTPVMPLGMSYIDDNVSTKSSAMFIGIIQSMFGVGTIFGFLVSAAVASKWVDFYRDDDADPIQLTPDDSLWVGAWWLGLLITSALYYLSSLPFFGFPRRLHDRPSANSADKFMARRSISDDNGEVEVNITNVQESKLSKGKSLLMSLRRLLTNPLFMWINLGAVCEMAVISSLVIFFPKYLETQFGLSPPEANFYMAVIPVPAVALGAIIGGYLVKKLSLRAEGAMKLALACSVVSLTGQLILLGVGCESVGIAGVDTVYPLKTSSLNPGVELANACNAHCSCGSLADPLAVCGEDGTTYVSACYAGCQREGESQESFFNCSCVQRGPPDPDGVTLSGGGWARIGACSMHCNTMVTFLAIMFVVALASSLEEIPQTMVTMRCVNKSDKSLALGLKLVFIRIFGNIPAPLYYGIAIDATCRLWRQSACGDRGECWAYDLEQFRYSFMGVTVALKCISSLSYVVCLILIKKKGKIRRNMGMAYRRSENNDETAEED